MSETIKISENEEITKYYEQNKEKSWKEWLSFDSLFKNPGKQGIVGLFKLNNGFLNTKIVFKISQYINYLVHHEFSVMKGLNDIAPYCPHFCKTIGSINCDVNPKYRSESNPFDTQNKKCIKKETLLCEYIEKSNKFCNYIKSKRISDDMLFSNIKQVLMGISIAQRKKQFSHYDLHSHNIMIKKCDKNTVFLYALDEENQFAVPTRGYYPVIIDFGFSYIKDLEDGPLWPSMAHTDVGFMSDRFDWVADPKLFLVTISDEMKMYRGTKKAKKLRNIVRNIFNPLNIDWKSGWDQTCEIGASNLVAEKLSKHNPGSVIFDNYDYYCMDIIQSLIILPIEEQDYTGLYKSYSIFVKEFLKIEKQISSQFYNLYILKGIVDAARFVMAGYSVQDTRVDSIQTFRKMVSERVDEVVDFCSLENIHYEKMLCSLLILSRSIEGIFHDIINDRMETKKKEYKKMPVKNIEQIYAAIEINIPDKYIYTNDTNIIMFDILNEKVTSFKLEKDQISDVNNAHPLCKGTVIYDLYTKGKLETI